MTKIALNEIRNLGIEATRKKITNTTEIIIEIPLPSVGVTQNPIDIAIDYLIASYIVESIAKQHTGCSVKKVKKNHYYSAFELTCHGYEIEKLVQKLYELSEYFDDTTLSEKDDLMEKIADYEDSLENTEFTFPFIVDDYYANLICGHYLTGESVESVVEDIKQHPERAFGYWYSAEGNGKKVKYLVSIDSYITPKIEPLSEIVKRINENQECELSLLNAEYVKIGTTSYVVSEGRVCEFNAGIMQRAFACIRTVTRNRHNAPNYLEWDYDVLRFSPLCDGYINTPTEMAWPWNENVGVFLSEQEEYIVIETSLAYLFIYELSGSTPKQKEKLIRNISQISSSVEDSITYSSTISLPWDILDDELFEQLCYDIIYHNEKFDRTTIRKMGKSRSRDGGRDIEVHTKPLPGSKSLKYIFQCKYFASHRSASTTNTGTVSDVIDQYGAEGYGLFCSCYIDAALYDRFDGISKNRKIEMITYSKFEIERFLSRRPVLKNRYFHQKQ